MHHCEGNRETPSTTCELLYLTGVIFSAKTECVLTRPVNELVKFPMSVLRNKSRTTACATPAQAKCLLVQCMRSATLLCIFPFRRTCSVGGSPMLFQNTVMFCELNLLSVATWRLNRTTAREPPCRGAAYT